MIHIVLVHPKMPSNTGNIIRLCANTGAKLHLLEPLAFELDDKKLRRAGLDYHEYADLKVHKTWADVRASLTEQNCNTVVAMTTKFSKPFYEYAFNKSDLDSAVYGEGNDQIIEQNSDQNIEQGTAQNIALVFGSETAGLPDDIRDDIGADNWLRLPMLPDSRSLNLSNSVAICLYEVWRQLGFYGDEGKSIGYHKPTSL